MAKVNCWFCNLKNGWVFENEHFFSLFDDFPVSPGHALVIPKVHTVSLLDLDSNQWYSLQEAIKETVKVIENTSFKELYQNIILEKPAEKSDFFCKKMLIHKGINKRQEGYNIGVNEGEIAGRTIHHLHIHVIPRYKGDVENPRGGNKNNYS